MNITMIFDQALHRVVLNPTGLQGPAPAGGGVSEGDKGDITVTGGVWTIDDGVVTDAKIASVDWTKLTGVPATFAPSAHVHSATDLTSGILPAARFDDTTHGSRSGGTLHAAVIAGGSSGFMTGTDKAKLDGVAPGATANASDAALLARANHTGTQPAATISDFAASVIGSVLTGFSAAGSRAAIVATDTVLAAFGKVQKWLNDLSAIAFSGSGADLTANSVPNAKLAQMATARIKGRVTAGTGDPEDLTGAQVVAMLPNVSVTAPGLAVEVEPGINRFYVFDDMVANTGDTNWTVANSGTGAGQSTTNPLATGLGWISFGLGTTATGRTARHMALTAINLGDGVANYICRGQINALSSGTDTYSARWGLIDAVTGESVDGVFLRYTDGVNGGKFQAVTRSNNVETVVDTGITAAISTTYKFEIAVDASTPSAIFKINGTTVATITTNIPSGLNRVTGAGIMGLKSVGLTATTFWTGDYQSFEQMLVTRT